MSKSSAEKQLPFNGLIVLISLIAACIGIYTFVSGNQTLQDALSVEPDPTSSLESTRPSNSLSNDPTASPTAVVKRETIDYTALEAAATCDEINEVIHYGTELQQDNFSSSQLGRAVYGIFAVLEVEETYNGLAEVTLGTRTDSCPVFTGCICEYSGEINLQDALLLEKGEVVLMQATIAGISPRPYQTKAIYLDNLVVYP